MSKPNESISQLTFVGQDVHLVLSDNFECVKKVYSLAAETMNAYIKVFVEPRDPENQTIEWMIRIRSPEGQRSLHIQQNSVFGNVTISDR